MLQKNKLLNITTLLALLIFVDFIIYAYMVGLSGFYSVDAVILAMLTLFLYFSYRHWNLSLPIYTLIILGFILHQCGVFGWYNISPIGLEWDHITHVVPLFGFTAMFYSFANRFMNRRFFTKKNLALFAIILLAGSGIGCVIELFEFSGFLMFGFGEGALRFGVGDAMPQEGAEFATAEQIEEYGGGWFNTMYDIVWNSIGALLAMIVMSFAYFVFRKPDKNLFDDY